MRAVVEALLKDVDPEISSVMLAKAEARGDNATLSEYSGEFANWELLPDPVGVIIEWQLLRHENRDRA